MTFRSKVKDQNDYFVAANAGDYVTPDAKIYVKATWNRLTHKKGDTTRYDRGNSTAGYSNNTAGIEITT